MEKDITTNNSGNNFVKGALLLSMGGLLAKILGALYRIPLTNIIGSYGMGLYQLVFPPYILFLTVCQAGVPVALSRLTAQYTQLGDRQRAHKVFSLCFVMLLSLGILGAGVLALSSNALAQIEGNIETARFFVLVAPALVFVPITNVFKGYFQGNMNMLPSSVTTVIEQVVKLVIGLATASHFMPNVHMAVSGAVLAITASELMSLIIMTTVYIVHRKRNNLQLRTQLDKGQTREIGKQIFGLAFPIALGAFVMQLSQVIDSVMVVNLLDIPNATNLYGLWTGPVNSMLGLPIALSAGVAVSALPSITRTYVSGNTEHLHKSYNSAMKLTFVIALPCALGMIALSRNIISLLYSSLPSQEITISAILLSISGISIVFLAIVQTSVSILQGIGKPYVSVVILAVSIIVKAVANLIFLPIDSINVYGAAISETLCYLVASCCVLVYISTKLKFSLDVVGTILKPLCASLIMTVVLSVLVVFCSEFLSTKLGTLIAIALGGIIYIAAVFVLKIFDTRELHMVTSRGK